ncbi:VanZ family protein [Halalkalibacter urbisdiaboli]|uniref:VanZ family protein n=1 Tax=Halalkalibacter urbisdiaboli TaxID=1960589 RepID=UPI000B44CC51|nr:VanZ family protein [Halalkalibacter urbisdiaboli]
MIRKHRKTFLYVILGLYVLALFYVTLFAWNYGASLGPVGPGGRNYNLTPFRSIYRIAVFSQDVMDPIRILLGNVILFIPLGFLLPLTIRRLQHISVVFIIGFSTSLFIEVCQFLFTQRVSNIDDVILNSSGTFIGTIFYLIISWVKKRIVVFQV